jgi:hypothetical protein
MYGREGGLFRLEDTSKEAEDSDVSSSVDGIEVTRQSSVLSCPAYSSVFYPEGRDRVKRLAR